MAGEYYRSLEEIWEDCLWPGGGGLSLPDPYESQRHGAIARVLCSMPTDGYEKLKEVVDSFYWFVPHYEVYGQVYPFPITFSEEVGDTGLEFAYSKVICLSPRLEQAAWDIVVAVVAHELAHIVLDHKVFTRPREQYDAQEAEAFALLCEWGFEREAKKLRAQGKWRDSRKKTLIKKLRDATVRPAEAEEGEIGGGRQ